MIRSISVLRDAGRFALAAAFLFSVGAAAQNGSALGELAAEGDVSIQRGTSTSPAGASDAVLAGDTIITGSGGGASVNFIQGGDLNLFGGSSAQLTGTQMVFGSGGGCFSGLAAPVDIVAGDGTVLASGVTSGGVFNGVYYAACPQALAALQAAGGGATPIVQAAIAASGALIGYEIVNDDPVHGN